MKELKGFRRITLGAGEKQRVEFSITKNDLQFWSDHGWTVEPATFKVWIGPSSVEGLEGTFEVK